MSSFVWKHFKKDAGKDKARCDVDLGKRKCNAVLSCTGGSTKGLIDHLKRIHQILDPLKSGPTASNSTQPGPSTSNAGAPPVKRQKLMTEFHSRSLEEMVAFDVAVVGMNFEQVVSSTLGAAGAECKFPTKKMPKNGSGVAKMVRGYYEEVKIKTKKWIQTHLADGNFFSTTLDEWTSTAGRRFLNINLHYFENGVAKEINLGMVAIYGSATALNIKKLVS